MNWFNSNFCLCLYLYYFLDIFNNSYSILTITTSIFSNYTVYQDASKVVVELYHVKSSFIPCEGIF